MGIFQALAEQLRRPDGLFGRLVAWGMARQNAPLYRWVTRLLDLRPTDTVLELGFGPGAGIEALARAVPAGRVAGVDFSEMMVKQASRRNAAAIAAGRVDLRLGNLAALPFDTATFDKVVAVNVIYFLPNPPANLQELHRVLKPGGRAAFFFVDKADMSRARFAQTGVFTLYSAEEVPPLLSQAGFRRAWLETKTIKIGKGVCALAEK